MLVTKRNGDKVEFNIDKIKKVIKWATDGINVNPLILETKSNIAFYEGIKTELIQENLIQTSNSLLNINEPDWTFVSGRLLFMQLWKNIVLKRGYKYDKNSFYKHIINMCENNCYELSILSYFTEEEIKYLGNNIIFSNDLTYNYPSINLFQRRYLLEDELPQEMFMIISMWLSINYPQKDKLNKTLEIYNILSNKKLSLATPILLNLRKPNPNLASCFIIDVEDSLESITEAWRQIAQISKNSGGVGCSISKIRCKGSSVMGNVGASNGVSPWIKIINDIALAVDQSGNKRSGAVTVALDIWHYDIPDFLHIQSETGEIRLKSYDIFPQIVMNDVFMQYAVEKKEWRMFDPYEIKQKYNVDLTEIYGKEFSDFYNIIYHDNDLKLVRTVNARDFITEIGQVQVNTGLPYVMFKDQTNLVNPNAGVIKCTNLCTESHSSFNINESHICNLASLNLTEIENETELEYITQSGIEILDNLIDISSPPIQTAKNHNDSYRVIGLGVMGLADYLAKHDVGYINGKDKSAHLFELIAYNSYLKTIQLGKERGNFKKHEQSKLKQGIVLGKLFFKDKYIEIEQLINEGLTMKEIEEINNNLELKELLFS